MKPEAALQAAAWVFAQQVLPDDADYAAIETKLGYDNKQGGAFRKMLGIRAGECDARVIYKGRTRMIEFKAPGGSLSDAQHKRHAQLHRAGVEVFVVRSIASLRAVFVGLGIPLRHHALSAETRDEMLAARRAAPKKPPAKRRPARVSSRLLALAARHQAP